MIEPELQRRDPEFKRRHDELLRRFEREAKRPERNFWIFLLVVFGVVPTLLSIILTTILFSLAGD